MRMFHVNLPGSTWIPMDLCKTPKQKNNLYTPEKVQHDGRSPSNQSRRLNQPKSTPPPPPEVPNVTGCWKKRPMWVDVSPIKTGWFFPALVMLVFSRGVLFGFALQKKRPQSSSKKLVGDHMFQKKSEEKHLPKKYITSKTCKKHLFKKKWWPNLGENHQLQKLIQWFSDIHLSCGWYLDKISATKYPATQDKSRGTKVQVVQVCNDHEKSNAFCPPYLLVN